MRIAKITVIVYGGEFSEFESGGNTIINHLEHLIASDDWIDGYTIEAEEKGFEWTEDHILDSLDTEPADVLKYFDGLIDKKKQLEIEMKQLKERLAKLEEERETMHE